MIKNSTLNGVSQIIPGIFFIPASGILSRTLGFEEFGFLLLIYALLGYSSIFDAGMSRAVIRKIAKSRSINEDKEIIGTALFFVLFISLLPTILIANFSEDIVRLLNVSSENSPEAIKSITVASFAIPCFIISSVAFSYLEGKEKFFELAIYKTLSGILLATLPAIFAYKWGGLVHAVIGLLMARAIAVLISILSIKLSIGLKGINFKKYIILDLIMFGSWISLSNIISPIMSYFDRFILSNITGASSSVFYNICSDLIEKIAIIPGALSRTLFPVFSRVGAHKLKIFNIYFWLGCVLLLVLLPIFVLSKELLNLWLGPSYGENSFIILRILILGFFFNGLAQIPYSILQSYGYSKTTALIHIFELMPYLGIFFYLTYHFGLVGAACAWSIRVTVDFICLLYFSNKIQKSFILNLS